MAEPTPPTAPSAVNVTVNAALRTITITTVAQLEAYINRTGDTLGPGGVASGGPTYGDDVVLAVGTYNLSDTPYLPTPAGTQTGNDYVTFRSASLSSLPPSGTRVATTDSTSMPRINAANNRYCFRANDNIDHYRFQGLNLTTASGVTAFAGLMLHALTESTATWAHHMIVDRCLIHGDPTGKMARGVQGAGPHHSIIDSRIYDIQFPNGENHGILWSAGPGPYLVQNSEVACDGICVFVGDSTVHVAGEHPANITIKNNYIHFPETFNNSGYIYNSGTCSVSGDGLTITLTGTVDADWNDGSTYFLLAEIENRAGTLVNWDNVILITGVNVGAKTLTLNSAMPVLQGTSGKHFFVTRYTGVIDAQFKNLMEVKDGSRILIEGNVLANAANQAQQTALTIASVHGTGAGGFDVNFKDNRLSGCTNAINFLARPSVGQGTQWTAQTFDAMPSGPRTGRVRVTTNGNHLASTGETAEINAPSGCVEADGVWTITVESATTFTIPVTFVNAGSGAEGVIIWQGGTPTSRIAVTNNVFENVGSDQATNINNPNNAVFFTINNALDLGDGSLSTTGSWAMTDWLIEHNTVVAPDVSSPDWLAYMLDSAPSDIDGTQTRLPIQNFTWRNNVIKQASPTFAPSNGRGTGVREQSPANYGGAALDGIAASASRLFSHNAFFSLANAVTSPEGPAIYSSPESTTNAWVTDNTNIGFTSYASGAVTNYALTDLWAGTCDVSAANPAVLTSPSVNFPATIMAGTPFKVNSDGTFVLVATRDSDTQVTLASTYPTTGSTLTCTLGFKGWSTDGADPGVNTTTLAAAIAGVEDGTPSGDGSVGVGALALVGLASVLGLGIVPSTP